MTLDGQAVVEIGVTAAACIVFAVDLRARVRGLEAWRREIREEIKGVNTKLDRIERLIKTGEAEDS